MEALILIALIIVIIALFINKSSNENSLRSITQLLSQLVNETRNLKAEIIKAKQSGVPSIHPVPETEQPKEQISPQPEIVREEEVAAEEVTAVEEEAVVTTTTVVAENSVTEKEEETILPPVAVEPSVLQQEHSIEPEPAPLPVNQLLPVQETPQRTLPPEPELKESWWDRWLRNNPDLEKFIGENLINKIGITILVLGIGFFVKYAIDKNWINETGRVSIGLLCGALLVGIAHYLRNSYRAFSSVLAGGGITVFYFSIAFAFQEYHKILPITAFIIMVIITAFAVALSVLYDKIELAVIAAIGGFITPFLVSTGNDNYIMLFTYLVVLNVGLLTLSYFKRWPLVNIISLFFTVLIFAGWMVRSLLLTSKPFSHPLVLLFATLFYLIFLGMNMLYQIKNRRAFRAFDFCIILFLNASYYAAGMTLLHTWNNGAYQGLFTLGIGVINLGFAWFFFRKSVADRNLLFLLIGLTLTFITLAIPVQLHGHAITLFWSAEMVLLLWLYKRSGIELFKQSSVLIGFLAIISLVMDWNNALQGTTYHLSVLFTGLTGIVTNVVAAVAIALYGWLSAQQGQNEEASNVEQNSMVKTVAYVLASGIFYLTCIFGVNLYFGMMDSYYVPNVYHRLITFAFGICFFLWYKKRNPAAGWKLVASAVICYLVQLISTASIVTLRNDILAGRYPWHHWVVQWISLATLLYLIWSAILHIKNNRQLFTGNIKNLSRIIPVALVILISIECLHLYIVAGYGTYTIENLQHQYSKAILTIVWAVCSFLLMWTGMKFKNKTLRIVSLCLFSLALLKLFFADLRGISETGKIAAFILLGVLLLIISFMYQKLKKIIIDDVQE